MGTEGVNSFDVNSMKGKTFSKDKQIVEVSSKQVHIETQTVKPPVKQKE